jgi:predicted MFS family arabinose efflux permease
MRPVGALPALLAGYGLFGAGYIAYMTFIVAYLSQQGATSSEIGLFWILLGVSAVAGNLAWAPVLARFSGGRGPALTLAAVLAGTMLPVLSGSMAAAYASALIFGGSFLAAPAAVTGSARQVLPQRHWTSAIAGLTVTFSAGQCLGPVLAGVLSDGPGGVRAGLTTGAVILTASIAITLCQPSRKRAFE